jgi:hypothetical protein
LKEAEQNTAGKPLFQNLNTPQMLQWWLGCRLSKFYPINLKHLQLLFLKQEIQF